MDDRDREYLAQMLQYALLAVEHLGPADAARLTATDAKFLAVSRSLQNIGEAASRVTHESRSELAALPWKSMIGMRHHLVHGYDDIHIEIVVGTIREDLPPLILSLQRALKDSPR